MTMVCKDHNVRMLRLYRRIYEGHGGKFVPYAWYCPVDNRILTGLDSNQTEDGGNKKFHDLFIATPETITDSNSVENAGDTETGQNEGAMPSDINRVVEKNSPIGEHNAPIRDISVHSDPSVFAPKTLSYSRNFPKHLYFHIIYRPQAIGQAHSIQGAKLKKLLEDGDIYAQKRVGYSFLIPDRLTLATVYGLANVPEKQLSKAIIKGEKIDPDAWV